MRKQSAPFVRVRFEKSENGFFLKFNDCLSFMKVSVVALASSFSSLPWVCLVSCFLRFARFPCFLLFLSSPWFSWVSQCPWFIWFHQCPCSMSTVLPFLAWLLLFFCPTGFPHFLGFVGFLILSRREQSRHCWHVEQDAGAKLKFLAPHTKASKKTRS